MCIRDRIRREQNENFIEIRREVNENFEKQKEDFTQIRAEMREYTTRETKEHIRQLAEQWLSLIHI